MSFGKVEGKLQTASVVSRFFIVVVFQTERLLQEAVFFFQRLVEFGVFCQLRLQVFVGGGNIEEIFGQPIFFP